jgi:hypothetical protein
MNESVTVPLPADLAEWLKAEAARQERSKAFVAAQGHRGRTGADGKGRSMSSTPIATPTGSPAPSPFAGRNHHWVARKIIAKATALDHVAAGSTVWICVKQLSAFENPCAVHPLTLLRWDMSETPEYDNPLKLHLSR